MLVDTNILVYAINVDSSKHKKATEFLQEFKTDLEVAHQNILESLRVLTHPKFAQVMSAKKIPSLVKSIYFEIEDRSMWLDVLALYPKANLDMVDIFLFEKAKQNGGEVLSFDQDFVKLK